MGVGDVQNACIAEAFDVVDTGGVGTACQTRQRTREGRGACKPDKIPAADVHAIPSAHGNTRLAYFQILPELFL